MVTNRRQLSAKTPANQGPEEIPPEPNEIGASTPYDFRGKNLTPYGGLLPVATMLEKLGFQSLVEKTVTVKRATRAMSWRQFVLGMVLGIYVGFSRLNQLRFIAQDPLLTGILKVSGLPPQSTLRRFPAALHLNVAVQILSVQRQMRERVWAAANVRLTVATLDTDTTVHTLYGKQMGGRKSYNPKNKGKKSYQPIPTFLAETREYVAGGLRNGDRPDGKEVAAYLERGCQFVIVARKTSRLLELLNRAEWKPSPKTDADEQCEFTYQPDGWGKALRFVALRYAEATQPADEVQQYQLFATNRYTYRVFVTSLKEPVHLVVAFYNGRAGAENLIKEANNDAGLAAHPSGRFDMNRNFFQMVMLAYNLNCWLMLFNREEQDEADTLRHTTLATARLRFMHGLQA
jgi:hypothetical protein